MKATLAPIAKALVPTVIGAIILLLEGVGITPDMSVREAVEILVTSITTSIAVYYIPNKHV